MGPAERRARAIVRRHARRTNPASLRLARTAVELGQAIDEGAAVERELEAVIRSLRECRPDENILDTLAAKRYDRRRQAGLPGA